MKKKILLSSIVAICLIAAFVVPKIVQAKPIKSCYFVAEYIADDTNYNLFYICDNNILPVKYHCPDVAHFNPWYNVCSSDLLYSGIYDDCTCRYHKILRGEQVNEYDE